MKTSAQQKFTQLLPTQNQVMSQGSSPVTGLPITRILLYPLDLNLVSLAHTLYTSCLLHRYQKFLTVGFKQLPLQTHHTSLLQLIIVSADSGRIILFRQNQNQQQREH